MREKRKHTTWPWSTFTLAPTVSMARWWRLTFGPCSKGAASCFRCWKQWKDFLRTWQKAFDWSILPHEKSNCGIKERIDSSHVTSYYRFSFIAVITRNHGSIQSRPLGDSAGKLRPLSRRTVAEWVLAAAPSRARKAASDEYENIALPHT